MYSNILATDTLHLEAATITMFGLLRGYYVEAYRGARRAKCETGQATSETLRPI